MVQWSKNQSKKLKNYVENLKTIVFFPFLYLLEGPNNEEPQLVPEKWTFLCDDKKTPLIVCVNSRSGGQKGEEVLRSFYKFLNPVQVIDLINEGIGSFEKFKDLPKWKVLAAGGDGTVSSVTNYIYDVLKPRYYPEVGIVPLGTGNDLSRVLGWGKTIDQTDMYDILHNLDEQSTLTLLDRWKLTFTNKKEQKVWSGLKRKTEVKTTTLTKCMYNYFGIGLDAKITKDFHTLRDQYPSLFTNRVFSVCIDFIKAF